MKNSEIYLIYLVSVSFSHYDLGIFTFAREPCNEFSTDWVS